MRLWIVYTLHWVQRLYNLSDRQPVPCQLIGPDSVCHRKLRTVPRPQRLQRLCFWHVCCFARGQRLHHLPCQQSLLERLICADTMLCWDLRTVPRTECLHGVPCWRILRKRVLGRHPMSKRHLSSSSDLEQHEHYVEHTPSVQLNATDTKKNQFPQTDLSSR